MEDKIYIQIRFTIDDYSDAIVLTTDEYDQLSEVDIDRMKQDRYESWLVTKSTPPPQLNRSERLAVIEEQIGVLNNDLASLKAEKDTLTEESP